MSRGASSSGSSRSSSAAGKSSGGTSGPKSGAGKDKPAAAVSEGPKIKVTLLQLGGNGEQEIELSAGSTVANCLEAGGLSGKDGHVLVNSTRATLETQLADGAKVVFANNIEGGCR